MTASSSSVSVHTSEQFVVKISLKKTVVPGSAVKV